MKTTMTITIETPDQYEEIFPEEGQNREDYKGKEQLLRDFQEQFAKDIHQSLKWHIKKYFEEDGWFEDNWIDDQEELFVEGWDSLKDYKVKLTVDNP